MLTKNTIYSKLPASWSRVNWSLLIFLILVLNVKLLVKVAAVLVFAFLNRRLLTRDIFQKKFILFYGAMIGIAVLNTLLMIPSISIPYLAVLVIGIGSWLLAGLCAALLAVFVQRTSTASLHATLIAFFIANAIVTLLTLLLIMIDSGSINPYTFQGYYQKYFISTGDWMKGISFDISTTNALFNSFGVMYFLTKRNYPMTFLCMIILILASSNFTVVLLLAALGYMFVFQTGRNQKSVIVVCLLFLLTFLAKISPQNNEAAINIFRKMAGKRVRPTMRASRPVPLVQRPDSVLNEKEKKQKLAMLYLDSVARLKQIQEENQSLFSGFASFKKPVIPGPDIHSDSFQMSTKATPVQEKIAAFAIDRITGFDTNSRAVRSRKTPGKVLAFRQTCDYFKAHPQKLLTGTGMGRFSSKLAFRATDLQIAGGYPNRFVFIDSLFMNNHLKLYITYFSKHKELHSLIHTPNSVYDQLIAEYGLLGIGAFLWLYAGFFLRKFRVLTYGLPVLMITLGALAIDYWFEQLSITVLFELMLLLNLKEAEEYA